jgi:sec-independent protein translocase protein TatA
MGEFSPFHWMIVALVILVLFGGRKIPEVMRGLGQGIKEFKEGMRTDSTATAQPTPPPPQTVGTAPQAPPVAPPPTSEPKA